MATSSRSAEHQKQQQARQEALYASGRAVLVAADPGSGAAGRNGDLNGAGVAKATNAAVADSAEPQAAPLKEHKDFMNVFLFLKIVSD